MLPTASHNLKTLTQNVPVTQEETGVWTKVIMKTVQTKIKVTKLSTKVLTLKKLYRRGVGTDGVERFIGRETSSRSGEGRKLNLVRRIMMLKMSL